MRKLVAFSQITLNGYFADASGDMSWAHTDDAEFNAFVADNAKGGGTLLFGRVTYDMMASFWPTPLAKQTAPVVAERMNALPKIVFSRTMESASWQNTRVVKGDIAAEVRKMKSEPGPGMAILGSGSILSQLALAAVIDEYQIVLNPLLLGKGKTLYEDMPGKLPLKLTSTRTFPNGYLFLTYTPKG